MSIWFDNVREDFQFHGLPIPSDLINAAVAVGSGAGLKLWVLDFGPGGLGLGSESWIMGPGSEPGL